MIGRVGRIWNLIVGRFANVAFFLLGVATTQLLIRIFNSPEDDRSIFVISATVLIVAGTLLGIATLDSLGRLKEASETSLTSLERTSKAELDSLTTTHSEALGKLENQVSALLGHVWLSHAMTVQFLDDNETGRSYDRIGRLIENAKKSVLFLDWWEPFDGYQSEGKAATERDEFYDLLIAQVDALASKPDFRHKRIVQVPNSSWKNRTPVPFYHDPPFQKYLHAAARAQEHDAGNCLIRIAPALFRVTFAIIDDHMVIMPILSQAAHNVDRQIRYGALLVDDQAGDLVRELKTIVRKIEGPSYPLESGLLSLKESEAPIDLRQPPDAGPAESTADHAQE